MVSTSIMTHSRVSSSTWPWVMTRSTISPDSSGMMRAMVLFTQNSTTAPATRGRSGLQYGRIHARLPACWLRFGSTYIRSVPSNCLLGSWLGCCWVIVGLWCCGHSLPPRFTSVVCRASRHRHAAAGRNPCSDSQTRLILNEPYADATDAFSACRNHNKINIYTVTYHWFAGAAKTVIGAWLAGIGASHRNIAR